ncbi:MAG: protein-L-isoaspartate(D-aspartate) O-methyltransferase [Candidatus Aenigmatarchaeota archaeon]
MYESENLELVSYLKKTGALKSKFLEKALLKTPRHLFVPENLQDSAYRDYPLHIGRGQTISQPSTVVIMTQLLEPKAGQKILEIGSGSGWQSALLSRLVGKKGKVFTVELIPELADFARKNLAKFKIKNVKVVEGNGSVGLGKEAPFDGIIITAAAPSIPGALKSQLKTGGRIVAPVGNRYTQKMTVLKRTRKGFEQEEMPSYFAFVPLRGKEGFEE